MMDFPMFAQTLYPIIGAGSDYGDFVKTLLDAMTKEAADEVLDAIKKDTYKHYYYGKPSISSMARKLSLYLDEEEFVAYLDGVDDGVAFQLVDAFSQEIKGIDKLNFSTELAAYFKRILMTAAAAGRKNRERENMGENSDAAETEAANDRGRSSNGSEPKVVNQIQFNNYGSSIQLQYSYGPILVGSPKNTR